MPDYTLVGRLSIADSVLVYVGDFDSLLLRPYRYCGELTGLACRYSVLQHERRFSRLVPVYVMHSGWTLRAGIPGPPKPLQHTHQLVLAAVPVTEFAQVRPPVGLTTGSLIARTHPYQPVYRVMVILRLPGIDDTFGLLTGDSDDPLWAVRHNSIHHPLDEIAAHALFDHSDGFIQQTLVEEDVDLGASVAGVPMHMSQ